MAHVTAVRLHHGIFLLDPLVGGLVVPKIASRLLQKNSSAEQTNGCDLLEKNWPIAASILRLHSSSFVAMDNGHHLLEEIVSKPGNRERASKHPAS